MVQLKELYDKALNSYDNSSCDFINEDEVLKYKEKIKEQKNNFIGKLNHKVSFRITVSGSYGYRIWCRVKKASSPQRANWNPTARRWG